jgi:protoporphyrinogen oxidase
LLFSAYPKPSSYQFFNFIATRLQEPKRRSPFSAPPGKASVMLEIPSVGDDVWTMDEAELFERCKADLKGLGVNIEGKTVGYFTTRALHAYPVYTMDYRDNCNRIIDHLRILPDLVSCGRQGLFDYIFMDDAMLMGFEAARDSSRERVGEDAIRQGADQGPTGG